MVNLENFDFCSGQIEAFLSTNLPNSLFFKKSRQGVNLNHFVALKHCSLRNESTTASKLHRHVE